MSKSSDKKMRRQTYRYRERGGTKIERERVRESSRGSTSVNTDQKERPCREVKATTMEAAYTREGGGDEVLGF